jgi:hypothetical protein
MTATLRRLARRLAGVRRTPTYYLPWLTRPGLDCTLLLSNVEARFLDGHREGPFPLALVQHDADGTVAARHAVTLDGPTAVVELPLRPTAAGHGFVTVDVRRIQSDLYVTLSDGEVYAATHGRHEFVEEYPWWSRAALGLIGAVLAVAGRTLPAFTRHQYAYAGPGGRVHVLLLNLSDVTNRVRVAASRDGRRLGARLVRLPPRGSALVDVRTLGAAQTPAGGTAVLRLALRGNAWFNLYLVGAGPRDLAGPLSLMHVK